jgi:hypothetical protein
MIASTPVIWPCWAAVRRQVDAVIDIILHIGAHRTGTTTFQTYMRDNATGLSARDIGFWGPQRTRGGLFSGVLPSAGAAKGRNLERRAVGRIKINCVRAEHSGKRHLVISDENMIGSVRSNLRSKGLYSAAGERMARYGQAFQDLKIKVFMSIRAQDRYWASALGYGITRGRSVPDAQALDVLARSQRNWRDLITDVACALPNAQITVLPFETYVGQPDAQLALMTGGDAPRTYARGWYNATPHLPELRTILEKRGQDSRTLVGSGRWQPFDRAQVMAMREAHLDDLFWLHAGADGLATIIEETGVDRTGMNPAAALNFRGQPNEYQERVMV